jgi:enoyl-CoA hydratase/carnithine racemase
LIPEDSQGFSKDYPMPHIEVDHRGAVLNISIHRPDKKNALTGDMYLALSDAMDRAESDRAVRVILLQGQGDTFTAGNDLEDFMHKPWKGQAVPPPIRFIRSVAFAKKPVIAAVHGLAIGIGTTILLHCDLVYAADDARFMMPFINLGIVPEAATTFLLPLLVGRQRAAELFLLGTTMTAQRACDLGLVNAVLPREELLPTATATAQQISERPQGAVLACKDLMKRAFHAEIERALKEEEAVITERLDSPETKEALTAFLEKRKPDFSRFYA